LSSSACALARRGKPRARGGKGKQGPGTPMREGSLGFGALRISEETIGPLTGVNQIRRWGADGGLGDGPFVGFFFLELMPPGQSEPGVANGGGGGGLKQSFRRAGPPGRSGPFGAGVCSTQGKTAPMPSVVGSGDWGGSAGGGPPSHPLGAASDILPFGNLRARPEARKGAQGGRRMTSLAAHRRAPVATKREARPGVGSGGGPRPG